MLKIEIPAQEGFDEEKMEFVELVPKRILYLEHSLVSLSKWEAKYKKPFLDEDEKNKKTPEETLDYIKMMTITQNVPDNTYSYLTEDNIRKIKDYIQDKNSATWFNDKNDNKQGRKQILTSELIYGYMVVLQIPWEAQKWHLNRLLILIRVVNELNKPKDNKKTNPSKLAKNYKAMNAERLKRLGTPG